MKRFLLIIVLLLLQYYSKAQNFEFERFGLNEGLSHISVVSIMQDSAGYLWIGTENGLNRFDGYNFKIFRREVGNTKSITSNKIFCVTEINSNELWIGTEGGGCCIYNKKEDIFTPLSKIANIPKKYSDATVRAIYKDKNGTIWLGTNIGVLKIYKSKGSNNYTSRSYSLGDNSVNNIVRIFPAPDGNIFISSFQGRLFRYNLNTCTFEVHILQGVPLTMYPLKNDTYLAGTYKYGINIVNLKNDSSHLIDAPVCLKNLTVYDIMKDNQGNFWATGREQGLIFFGKNFANKNPTVITNQANNSKSVSANDIRTIFQDRSGIIWVGTAGGGLNKIDIRDKKFNFYNGTSPTSETGFYGEVRSFCLQNDNQMWVGTRNNGLFLFNKKTNEFKKVKLQYKEKILDKGIQRIVSDRNGNIWLATEGEGVWRYTPDKQTLINGKSIQYIGYYDLNNLTALSNNFVMDLHFDKKGRLWIGCWNGLNLLDTTELGGKIPKETKFRFFLNNANDTNSISNNTVMHIMEDSQNNLWFATRLGINKLEEKKNGDFIFKHYKYSSEAHNCLSDNIVQYIFEDSKKRFWIATQNGGLNLFNRKTQKFTHFDFKKGLTDNTIFTIKEDKKGNLWLGTIFGLIQYNHDNHFIRNYKNTDGPGNIGYLEQAAENGKNGDLFFGGREGLTHFYPDSLTTNQFFSPIEIISFKIFNKEIPIGTNEFGRTILTKSINYTSEITLKYNENNISFEFASLDFTNVESNLYTYKMEGIDNEWITTSAKKRFANYSNLSVGEYTFYIKGTNSDGLWNPNAKKIKIIILPPWWATTWFRILMVSLLIGAVITIYRIRIAALKARQIELEEKVKERTQELELLNCDLKEKQEEIIQQNEEIRQQAEELFTQSETLAQQNEKLIELDKFKETITGSIVHDLKNPLNSIIVLSEPMFYEDTDPMILNNQKNINQSGKQMLHLVMNILDVQKFENAKMKIDAQSISIYDVFESSLQQVPLLLEQKNIGVELLPSEQILIKADRSLLIRIITNLLTNAIKFTPKDGKIFLDAISKPAAGFATISVKDTGCGIRAEKLPGIFDKFNQAEARDLGQTPSTGLGLNFCKMAVEAHGGKIWVESEINVGTTFFFTLPIG